MPPRTPPFSDIDLTRWKEYGDVITDTLWLLGARDKTGPHAGDYWGNFVPQIPNQILRRFTRRGDVVVDLFCGMGTTLIECRHLGRHGIGVELSPEVAARARERIEQAENAHDARIVVLHGDSRRPETAGDVRAELRKLGKDEADCVILHPPYHGAIKFGDDPRDLSNAPTVEDFLDGFRQTVEQAVSLLAPRRHLALVIGDVYARGRCVPLGFYCADVCMRAGLQLKAINVKDIQGNERAKGRRQNLWRYRALSQGLYIFRHEYVMVFTKAPRPRRRGGAPVTP